ncbi:hypothetical protein CDD81_5890 [Ophiocordyceps australis]|uniref:Aminoglycoside phosphotransferase domain-containing protein n=1 Tax=Ophiocordyceps australis TaxID=1399860 RepID=A0A2C5XM20_9HYPO|nr:hypothetical protein CDD81_5890 [Ophiocordyceps australis]
MLRENQTIRKSVRKGETDLSAEVGNLMFVRRHSTVRVPQVYKYWETVDFQHVIMENLPGVTLESVWEDLTNKERNNIAVEVVAHLKDLRQLRSWEITGCVEGKKRFRPGLRHVWDFNKERIRRHEWHRLIYDYVRDRCQSFYGQANVFTHGDLFAGNIMILDKHFYGFIDLERSGFFPQYWEWMSVKRVCEYWGPGSWSELLQQHLYDDMLRPGWDGLWEVEKLIMALEAFSRPYKDPVTRSRKQVDAWARISEITGVDLGCQPVEVDYGEDEKLGLWIETREEYERKQEEGRRRAAAGD